MGLTYGNLKHSGERKHQTSPAEVVWQDSILCPLKKINDPVIIHKRVIFSSFFPTSISFVIGQLFVREPFEICSLFLAKRRSRVQIYLKELLQLPIYKSAEKYRQ